MNQIFQLEVKVLLGDNGALVLVDGIERPISGIDPNDIESITVLKDAASAAVYGARAANGVVLVTTRQGKAGKTQVSYSGLVGTQQPTVRPKMMNSYEYAKYFNEARVNSGNTPYYTDEEIQKFKSGKDPAFPNTDWWAASLHKGAPIQEHNMTIQGGTDKLKFIFSAGNLNQNGLYELSDFKRTNLRTNLNYKIDDNLTMIVDVSGRIENTSQSPKNLDGFNYILYGKPTLNPYVPDSVAPSGLAYNGLNGSSIGKFSQSGYDRNYSTILQSTVELSYKVPFLNGLSARARFAYDKTFDHNKTFSTPYTYYVYDQTNDLYTPIQSSLFPTLNEARGEGTQSTVQLSATYDHSFGPHTISALFLFEQIDGSFSNLSAYREGFLSPSLDQIFAGSDLNKNNGSIASENARQGYVGRVNYNYKDRYLLQANFRYDGSYNFSSNKRWGFFPAISAGWRISEEPFLKEQKWLSNLKIRASYGQFGNDRISPFQYLTGYVFSEGYITGSSFNRGIVDVGLPNPNVTWETATNRDIGLDFGLFNGKIESEITYFYKRTKDILLPRSGSVPLTFGAVLPDENIGVVDNSGLELLLRHTHRTGELIYTIEGNVTFAKNKVIFMDEPANVEDRIRKTGHPFDQFYGYVAEGFFQNQEEINAWADQDGQQNTSLQPGDIKYKDINGDHKIDGFDITRIGKSSTPEIVYGINLGASYKGFGFTTNFQGATGFNKYILLDPFALDANALSVNANAWRPDNPNAKYPRLTNGLTSNNNQVSSQWLLDNSYLRLRNVEVYYTFSSEMLRKLGVQSAKIFVSGNNVLTFSKNKFVDPESGSYHSDVLYYPQMKSYNVGLNVNL